MIRGRGRGRGHARAMQPRESTGMNKLKSALRQTRRLLAKDIAPGTRIEAERRLHALEVEMAEKMQASKEQKWATRYHKVKFFERQKLMRRIRQMRKHDSSDARAELFTYRMYLNYVMHYPADQRYVALFAEGTKRPVAPDANAHDRAHQKAAEFLKHVRKSMKKGTMSAEPDKDLDVRESVNGKRKRPVEQGDSGAGMVSEDSGNEDSGSEDDMASEASGIEDSGGDEDSASEDAAREDTRSKNPGRASRPTPAAASLSQDDFFA